MSPCLSVGLFRFCESLKPNTTNGVCNSSAAIHDPRAKNNKDVYIVPPTRLEDIDEALAEEYFTKAICLTISPSHVPFSVNSSIYSHGIW